MRQFIDLNADVGECNRAEDLLRDCELLTHVSSANIACGGHAGDATSMNALVEASIARGTAVGAHPSFPDRVNFGRRDLVISHKELRDSLIRQVESLFLICDERGIALSHIKPHGALYHAAHRDREIAVILAEVCARFQPRPVLVGLAESRAIQWWHDMGIETISEGFADRQYLADGTLMARDNPGAIIEDPEQASKQALSLAQGYLPATLLISSQILKVDTICVHSDTRNACVIAHSVRRTIESAGIEIRAMSGHSRSASD